MAVAVVLLPRPPSPLCRLFAFPFSFLCRRLRAFICESLANLAPLCPEELVAQRYERFRGLGTFDSLSPEERESAVSAASAASKPRWERERDWTTAPI